MPNDEERLVIISEYQDKATKGLKLTKEETEKLVNEYRRLASQFDIVNKKINNSKPFSGKNRRYGKNVKSLKGQMANIQRLLPSEVLEDLKREKPQRGYVPSNTSPKIRNNARLEKEIYNHLKKQKKELYSSFDEAGNKISQELVGGQLSKTTTTYAPPPKPIIRESVQGNIKSFDSVKGTLSTEEILDNGNIITRTYQNAITANGQWQASLVSEKTKIKQNKKEVKGLTKQHSLLQKVQKGSFGRIGRIFQSIIAFRLASAVLTTFINAFKKGFEAIKQTTPELVEGMQEFNNSTTAISVSLATALIPLMQSLSTLLSPLSEDLVNVANGLSLANAQAKNQSEYFKLSKEQIDEYAKSLNQANKRLTQLDKFATLSGKKSFALGEMVEINDETIKQQENEQRAVQGTINVLTKLFGILNKTNEEQEESRGITLESIKVWGLVALGIGAIFSPTAKVIAIVSSLLTLLDGIPSTADWVAVGVLGLVAAFIAVGAALKYAKSGSANAAILSGLKIIGFIGGITSLVGFTGGAISDIVSYEKEKKEKSSTPSSSDYKEEASVGTSYGSMSDSSDMETFNSSNSSNQPIVLNANFNVDGKKLASATVNYTSTMQKKGL